MKHAEIDRVQQDLDLIKSTLSGEFPYDRRHLLMSLLGAGAGVLVALTSVESMQPFIRQTLLIYFLGIVGFWVWHVGRVRSARAHRPRAWNWTRRETVAALVGIALLVSYVVTMRVVLAQRGEWSGVAWRQHIAGPVLFFVGVTLVSASVSSRTLWSWAGWGVPAAVGGLVILWCDSVAQTRLALGVALVIGGLASAAILHGQIRIEEEVDATD